MDIGRTIVDFTPPQLYKRRIVDATIDSVFEWDTKGWCVEAIEIDGVLYACDAYTKMLPILMWHLFEYPEKYEGMYHYIKNYECTYPSAIQHVAESWEFTPTSRWVLVKDYYVSLTGATRTLLKRVQDLILECMPGKPDMDVKLLMRRKEYY